MTSEENRTPAPPATIDLNELARKGHLDVSIKPAESELDGQARRWKDKVTFGLAVAMIGLVFVVCLCLLLFGQRSDDERRWLQSALTLILGAAVGAAFKK